MLESFGGVLAAVCGLAVALAAGVVFFSAGFVEAVFADFVLAVTAAFFSPPEAVAFGTGALAGLGDVGRL